MRLDERRLLAKREERWSRGFNSLDPAVLEIEADEAAAERRGRRLAIVAAAVVHVAAFWLVFPEIEPRVYEAGRTTRVYQVQQVRFEPPPPAASQAPPPRPRARLLPIPDPTPDAPEPLDPFETALESFEVPTVQTGPALALPDGPPGPAVSPIDITGDVQAPVKRFAPDPRYPEEARQARIQGVVVLQTVIDAAGDVRDVRVVKGLPSGLTEAAVEAVSRWRFFPATLHGEPVAVRYIVTITFNVQ